MENIKYFGPKRSNLEQLKTSDFNIELPDLKNPEEPKFVIVAKWLMKWIDIDTETKIGKLLPLKADMAYMLGISIGTMQNAVRYAEDCGYLESKQCIGTLIKDRNAKNIKIRKYTSKRDITINIIKKYILENNLKPGDYIPSTQKLSEFTGCTLNIVRIALEYLGTTNIINRNLINGRWILQTLDFDIEDVGINETLVKTIEKDLKEYIIENHKPGDKMPAHDFFAKKYSVSTKTAHDALKLLINQGVLMPRRGRYGTIVIKMPDEADFYERKETSIFAKAPDTAFYYYERTQDHIKRLIVENYQVGQKIPSIMDFSRSLKLSPNTVRRAFDNLAKEGYLTFLRGRNGGTFVAEIPDMSKQTFKWLVVNPKYAEVYYN